MRAAPWMLLVALPLGAADWMRLRTPEVELLTDAGESRGRELLARLAQVRGVFSEGRARGPLNLRIFVFASAREFRDYAPGASTGGFYQSGPERDYIVLPAEPSRVLVHEYIHLLLNRGSNPLPTWFEEGTAEFYSTLEVRGNRLVVGIPVQAHRDLLARQPWLGANELFSATARSSLYDERARAGVFYAQGWALVHMLNLSPDYRLGMPRLVELLASGRASEDALYEVYERTPAQVLRNLEAYLRRMDAVTVEGAPTRVEAPVQAERLPALDAILARAELGLRTNHAAVARRWYEEAARQKPDSSAVEFGLGMLALDAGDRASARKHLERAVALNAVDAGTWFEYAMFERESGAPRGRVEELLRKAVELNPNLAEAQFVLGVRATDDGRLEAGVAHLQEAVRVLPRQSSFWHALAFALEKLGRRQEALDAALRAVRAASTPEEDGMAQALLESLR